MKHHSVFALLWACLLTAPTLCFAQYEAVFDIPLPDAFEGMSNRLTIYSTPNPNFAELSISDDFRSTEIVWKHATFIRTNEPFTITETGAYLLYNGAWMLRGSFGEKETMTYFDIESLKLERGQTIVYEKNWRYDKLCNTGWNFWYVKGITAKGEQVFGYQILETKGVCENGDQLLGLDVENSTITWQGGAGPDYVVTGTIPKVEGKIVVNKNVLTNCIIDFDMTSMSGEETELLNHLKSKDFLHTDKFPIATFSANTIEPFENNRYKLTGELQLRSGAHTEVIEVVQETTPTAYKFTFTLMLDRTQYGMLYASSKKPDPNYSIDDLIKVSGTLSFKRDYPGALPWNTVELK